MAHAVVMSEMVGGCNTVWDASMLVGLVAVAEQLMQQNKKVARQHAACIAGWLIWQGLALCCCGGVAVGDMPCT